MSTLVLSLAMGDNQELRFPTTSSPVLGGLGYPRRHAEQLLNASILASVGQGENDKVAAALRARSYVDTSGVASHLRASSGHLDIESALRARGKSIDPSFAQQLAAIQSRGDPGVSLVSPASRYASLLLSQAASREAASLARAASSLSYLPSSLLTSSLLPHSLGAFSLQQNSFAQDPMFGRLVSAPAASAPTKPVKRSPFVLFMECDEESLSEYQCLIRKQIELFEADKEEAASSVQGRNKQIVEGQVGIRCRHCTVVPPGRRQKGSMYFPTKLDRIYQAAQNLSAFHLCETCKHVPEDVRKKILVLRERKSPAGGGKRYWGEGVRCLGVYESPSGLRFHKG